MPGKKQEIENRLRGVKLPDNANLVHCQVKNHLIINRYFTFRS